LSKPLPVRIYRHVIVSFLLYPTQRRPVHTRRNLPAARRRRSQFEPNYGVVSPLVHYIGI
jgi:hypothetical protein